MLKLSEDFNQLMLEINEAFTKWFFTSKLNKSDDYEILFWPDKEKRVEEFKQAPNMNLLKILNMIENAKDSIYIGMYHLTSKEIAWTLKQKAD